MADNKQFPTTSNAANPRVVRWLGLWLVLFWIVAAIEPTYRQDWLLENILVFLSAVIVLFTYNRLPFTTSTYVMLTVFMTLHLIGAHYTYSETPIGDWLSDIFQWDRNHYDRVVHFSFGLLVAPAVMQLIHYRAKATKNWVAILTALVILGVSALFEIIEAAAAIIVSPELGIAYLGTQGDIWDSQKDSALAFLGSILFIVVARVLRNNNR